LAAQDYCVAVVAYRQFDVWRDAQVKVQVCGIKPQYFARGGINAYVPGIRGIRHQPGTV
jgi:hypothetical protein